MNFVVKIMFKLLVLLIGISVLSFVVELILFLQSGEWHFFTIIELLNAMKVEVPWLDKPQELLGLHMIISFISELPITFFVAIIGWFYIGFGFFQVVDDVMNKLRNK